MQWRLNLIGAGLIIIVLVVIWRIFDLQIGEGTFLQKQGDARTVRIENIRAHRGMISDRRGKPLAISTPVGSVWADPRAAHLTFEQSVLLARALKIDQKILDRKLSSKRSFVYLRRHLPPNELEAISNLALPGVEIQREFKRFYPAGEVAAHVVGFTDIDDVGQEGIELAYDEWLKGVSGKKEVLKDLHGKVVKDLRPISEAQPGRPLALSIDMKVQYHAYRELKSAVHFYGAESGSVVIMDVSTGEIITMINQPAYNPNNRRSMSDIGKLRNRTVTDVFEPGSTVKPFTVAAGLQSGVLDEDSVIDTNPGFIKVGNKTIRDPSNRRKLKLAEILAKSSQVGITRIALSMDAGLVWKMFDQVGFGHPTSTGFPGERAGELPNHRRWKPIERATFAYGYGLTTTPLQLACAYQVIASNGYKKTATLLKTDPQDGIKVMDQRVAQQILAMLKKVVDEGTGTLAKINSYEVAGKTGTVRKVGQGGYQDTHHLAIFAGITPVDHPRLVAVVLINDPKASKVGGGAIAAPLFSRVMSGALRLLNVSPGYVGEAA